VSEIALTGAHALKIQTYTPDTMTLKSGQTEFFINDPKSLWYGRSLYDLYGEGQTPWEWHKPIFDFAKKLGLIAFSTPFDSTSVDFLEELNVPCYKIASFENIDLPLIAKVAKTGKPIIISTGMASLSELQDIVMTARASGCNDIILLKCTSTYPAEPVNSNLLTIPHLRKLFNCEVGLSDHTMGVGVSVASVALGATVIEKHFTLSRADGGVDSAFSMEPNEMAQLVVETNRAWKSLGKISYGPTPAELPSLQFRRSIYVIKDIARGELFTMDNIGIIRPGLGLPPKYIDIVLGKEAKTDLSRGTALNWEHI
jgi:N-acetylneuraminate synthase